MVLSLHRIPIEKQGSPDVLVAVVHGLVGGDGDGEELAGELQTGLVLEHNGATVDAEQIINCK